MQWLFKGFVRRVDVKMFMVYSVVDLATDPINNSDPAWPLVFNWKLSYKVSLGNVADELPSDLIGTEVDMVLLLPFWGGSMGRPVADFKQPPNPESAYKSLGKTITSTKQPTVEIIGWRWIA